MVKKLSHHLALNLHSNLSTDQKVLYLKIAKIAPPKYIHQVDHQSKLNFTRKSSLDTSHHQSSASPAIPSLSLSATSTCSPNANDNDCYGYRRDTRSYGRFPLDHPKLVELKSNLMSLDGKRKSEEVAKAIITDVSKYLYFCSSTKLKWKWVKDSSNLLK